MKVWIGRLAIVYLGVCTPVFASDFLTDLRAVEAGQPVTKAMHARWGDQPQLAELVAEASRQRIQALSIEQLNQLLKTYPYSATIANLRYQKWAQLGRQQRWNDVLTLAIPTDDVELSCYRLEALARTGAWQPEDARDAIQIWTHGLSRPKACDGLFRWLDQRGLITDEVRLRRIDRALSANQLNLAQWLAKPLNGRADGHIQAWRVARQNPEKYLLTMAIQFPEWVDMAAYRLAGDNPETALTSIPKLHPSVQQAASSAIARRLAIARDPSALALLKQQLPEHPVLDQWRVRFFLSLQDWPAVLDAIGRLPPTVRQESEWAYWSARALAMTGSSDLAIEQFRSLAEEVSWYGFLAADYLQLPYAIKPPGKRVSAARIEDVRQHQAIQLALALHTDGLTVRGRRQWDFATGLLSESEQQAAAEIAGEAGWASRAAITAHQSGLSDHHHLRYPLAHADLITQYSTRHQLAPAWVLGLTRSESLFMRDIRSPAGAIGLMQIMPATGRALAKTLNVTWRGNLTLIDPTVNVRFGTYYLKQQLERFGHPALATAAYNAGPNRVMTWLPRTPMALDLWVATIPFSETRNYVQRVLTAQVLYEWRYNSRLTRIDALVDPFIPAQDSST